MCYAIAMNRFILPIAILAAGIIIAGAVYITKHTAVLHEIPAANPSLTASITADDHVLGNPLAQTVFIEYSDIDCSYCKIFNKNLEMLVANEGANGSIALVYRHFPIPDENSYSFTHAEAAECVAAQGGSKAFFAFIDAIAKAAPDNIFDPSEYDIILPAIGINRDTFNECMQHHEFENRVSHDADAAIASGGTGAPFTVVIQSGDTEPFTISGAVSYDALVQIARDIKNK